MLTRDIAIKFLEETLGIDEVLEKAKHSKITLLGEFMKRFHRCIPFQNLTLMATEPEERCLPSFDKMIDSILNGHGGMCYVRSHFTREVFTTLGYNSHLIACSVPTSTQPYTHVAIIVTDVEQYGDVFLVEVGASYPSFEPVPLLALPKSYKHSFLEYRIVQEGNEYCRYHRCGRQSQNFRSDVDSVEWKKFYSFDDISRNNEFFKQYQTPIYTEPGFASYWYLTSLTMTVYPEGKAVTLSNYVLKVLDEQTGKLEVSEKLNRDQMQSVIQQYFPKLDYDDIIKVLDKVYPNSG